MKPKITLLSIVILISVLVSLNLFKEKGLIKVGLIFFTNHPAIDSGIEGFNEETARIFPQNGKELEIIYANAQAEIKNINSSVRSFKEKGVSAVIAITTPAAQVANKVLENKTPLIFVGVSDPIASGLVSTLSKGEKNITGTTSKAPVFETLSLALDVFPNMKKIGIIYTATEANSKVIIDTLDKDIIEKDMDISLEKVSINSTADIHRAAMVLAEKCDGLFLINDNTVISAVEIILKAADTHSLPVVACDIDTVKRGALFTLGLNYKDEGIAAARLLKEIVVDKVPTEKTKIYVNEKYHLYANNIIFKKFPNANFDSLQNAVLVGNN